MGDKQQIRGLYDRRAMLAATGLGLSAAALAGLGCKDGETRAGGDSRATGPAEPPAAPIPAADAQVRALFGDLADGATLDNWKIRRVHGVYMGAIPVILETAGGQAFQVDVLRRDPTGPEGVGNTESLSLYVSNTGDGSTKTDEEQGLGAIALAEALAQRESAGAAVPKLLTLKERHEAYPQGLYSVPV